ncbi:TonB-dependent receptor plug domain-containing protein (plasmid) [Pseudomonas silvicola]|nr:TonB-dependent receptor plug domain-containing protein [Pseudomonas silvicola]
MFIKRITLVKTGFTSAMLLYAVPLYATSEQPTIAVTASPNQPPAETDKKATLGNLGKQEVRNTPWSVQTLSPELMKRQQLKSVSDLYRYMPSVQDGDPRPQTRVCRAVWCQNSMIDGLNVVSTTDYAAEQFDQIEVLNGRRIYMVRPIQAESVQFREQTRQYFRSTPLLWARGPG